MMPKLLARSRWHAICVALSLLGRVAGRSNSDIRFLAHSLVVGFPCNAAQEHDWWHQQPCRGLIDSACFSHIVAELLRTPDPKHYYQVSTE